MDNPIISIITILISLSFSAILFKIVLNQVFKDLKRKDRFDEKRPSPKSNKPKNPFSVDNNSDTSKTNGTKAEVLYFEKIEKYMSLLSMLFSIILFVIIYEIFIKEILEFLEHKQNMMGVGVIPFLLFIAGLGASTTSFILNKIIELENNVLVVRVQSQIIVLFTFLAFTVGYVFLFEELSTEFNLIKGATLSLCLGVLFYFIFGYKGLFSKKQKNK